MYVDDVLIISHKNPAAHLQLIQAQYELNPGSIGPPTLYLADVWKLTRPGDPTGCEYWAISADTHIKNAV